MVVWTIAGYLVLTQNVTGAAGPVGIVQMIVTASPGDLVLAAGWVIGVAVGQQRVYADGLRQQAERRAQERILAERLRIAGELHDIVAHSMSLITVQAGVARYVVADRSGEAAQALASIEQTSRDALNEMRRLLGVLRGADGRREDPELGPAPRLADLDGLAAATMRTGLTVRVRRDGAHRELPAGVELAGYRVVQEALTNVIKHAAARKVDVLATYGPDELRIEIVDDGRGTPRRSSQGHGLIGLRERVTSYGGEFTAGPAPDAGFRVVATIPILPLAPDRSDLVAELVTS
jgi:signal transduction histidine kinase